MTPITSMRPTPKATALAAALLCALSAQAQNAAPNDDDKSVEKVIVTAQKREQAAIDVPASVSTVSADRLSRSGLVRLEDYAAQIPGMTITALSRGYSSVVLRGISTGISQATPSTAYYIDEAPIGSITAYATGSTLTPDLDPYDLRRVEVLKGPQGTLYGAGAVGGLLRYVTTPADSERFSGAISLGGNKVAHGGDGSEGRVSLNIPLATGMGLRVSLLDRTDAGYIDNNKTGQSDVNKATTRGGRVAWNWTVNPDWSVQAWAMTQKFKSGGIGSEDVNGPSLTPVTKELERGVYIPETQDIGLDVANATIRGRIGNFSVVSSTTYQTVKAETNVDVTSSLGTLFSAVLKIPNFGMQTKQLIDTKRWSQELRARSSAMGDRLEYEAGLFYTQEDSTNSLPPLNPFNTATGAPLVLGLPIANAMLGTKYKEYSLFGNATFAITPEFDILGGLRVSHDTQHYIQDYKLSLLTSVPVQLAQDASNSKTTYLLSARYKPAPDTAIYGRIATGYRAGGPSALPPDVVPGGKQTFQPDTLTSYELGFKSALMGGKASVEAAVFTTDWKDIQIQTSSGVTPKGNFNYFVNGGKAKSSGAEATLLFFPMAGLTLRGTAAYTDSHLTEDAPVVKGLNGDRMPFVPRVTGSLAADYRFPVAGMQAWVGGSISHIGERRSNFSLQPNALSVPAYSTVNLNAGVEVNKVRVTVYAKNLGDERGINFINSVGFPLNPYTAGIIQPRTFGVDVAYRF
jgi:outer membrane receptor protein involved in Fe transport